MDFTKMSKDELLKLAAATGVILEEEFDGDPTKADLVTLLKGLPKGEEEFYRRKTYKSLREHCLRRGLIPEEIESVRAAIATKYGKPLSELNMSDLRRVNRNMDAILTEYLGGDKRRPLPGGQPFGFIG